MSVEIVEAAPILEVQETCLETRPGMNLLAYWVCDMPVHADERHVFVRLG